jgi:tRNA (guanine37-N1)-methyltransferase
MIIDILTLFPEMFSALNTSIIKRAIDNEIVEIRIHDFRDFSTKKSKRVDDYSYGGGAGLIIEAEPIVNCLKSISGFEKAHKIITSPIGVKYSQNKAIELSNMDHLIIICGHYEGIDYRVNSFVDEEISIGDFILTGGEIASMSIVDSVVRLLPNVLGNDESINVESFTDLLEFPQYTRPVEFDGLVVPEVLMSGNHEEIRKYRRFESLRLTYERRLDLIEKANLSTEDKKFLDLIKKGESL